MKLRDFELTIETPDKDLRMKFRDQTRCMGALFRDCLTSDVDARGKKILVNCWTKAEAETRKMGLVYETLGVLRTGRVFDFDTFFQSSSQEKKRMAMEALYAGIIRVAEHEGLAQQPFKEAKRLAEERNLTHRWETRSKQSPGRKMRGHLECLHDVDRFEAWLVISDINGTLLHRASALKTRPEEFSFVPKIHKTKWIDKNTFALLDENLNAVSTISVSSELH